MDRITNISYRNSSGSLIRSLGYQYDAGSMITNIVTGNDSLQLSVKGYRYDTINRLTSEVLITDNGAQSTDYTYDLAGNRLTKGVDGVDVAYASIGNGNRLASWKAASATGFDSRRNVRISGTSSEPIGTDDRWGALYISNRTSNASVIPDISGTAFQASGFPLEFGTQEIIAAIRDQAGNVGYATNNVLLTVVTNAQFGYNAAGCITNIAHTGTGDYASSLALHWNEKYQLISVSLTASNVTHSTIAYSYDVLGRRISRTCHSPLATNEVHYVYSGDQVVADLDDSGNLLRTYTWGPGIDNLLSMTVYSTSTGSVNVTSSTCYALKNHQNSVIALVDEFGVVVESYEYDAWGRTTVFDSNGRELPASAIGNRYCFQGREYDSITGLYYFRARWYDPVTGRWLSKDPIGISGGLNLYAFCGNNPINFVDPFGHCGSGPDWGRVKEGLLGLGSAVERMVVGAGIMIGGVFVGVDGPLIELAGFAYASKGAMDAVASGTVVLAGLAGMNGSNDPFNTTILTTAAGLGGDSQTVHDVGVGEAVIDAMTGSGQTAGEVGIADALNH